MSKARKIGAYFANTYLGKEQTIVLDINDARYRYYQWLRNWYGFNKKEDTNKCPFYQFMFWGSMLMVVSIVPIILMKLVDLIILKPLSYVFPDKIEKIYANIGESKMLSSWILFYLDLVYSE